MKDNRRHPNGPRRASRVLGCINGDVAGIDCGSAEHYVAVPADRSTAPVQAFKTFTSDLLRLADWLVSCRVRSVAMEATGVYWIPIYDILEARGLTVLLVNARHIKHVPGRKSDVSDCEWLRDLHSVGLLRGSFRPTEDIVTLRTYLRHRHRVVESAGSYVQRMQQALVQMNVQLPLVVSDITGVTGLKILRDIVAGQRDIQIFQRVGLPAPAIGRTLVLIYDEGLPTERRQYVRVTRTETETRWFTYSSGGGFVDYQADVVKCSISDALRTSFPGSPPDRAYSRATDRTVIEDANLIADMSGAAE